MIKNSYYLLAAQKKFQQPAFYRLLVPELNWDFRTRQAQKERAAFCAARHLTSSGARRDAVPMNCFRRMASSLARHLNLYLLSRELTYGHWQDFELGSSQAGFMKSLPASSFKLQLS